MINLICPLYFSKDPQVYLSSRITDGHLIDPERTLLQISVLHMKLAAEVTQLTTLCTMLEPSAEVPTDFRAQALRAPYSRDSDPVTSITVEGDTCMVLYLCQ